MRYFIEVSYKGTKYAGFQVQLNAETIQGELEKALETVTRRKVELTGSSRTDAGVHALQNYFHFDFEQPFKLSSTYNINALLPRDIVVKRIFEVPPEAHARFLAVSREYKYFIIGAKDPFQTETAWYFPYSVDIELLKKAAEILKGYNDFTSFSKRNTEAFTRMCTLYKSEWSTEGNTLIYNVKANRFLRGMVRGLVGTMLQVGRKRISLKDFENIITAKDCTKANFATPAHGLFLVNVEYPELSLIN